MGHPSSTATAATRLPPSTPADDHAVCTRQRRTLRTNPPCQLGNHFITLEWHRMGAHQLSCKYGKHTQYRHHKVVQLLSEIFALAGVAVDPTETFVSPTDNKRADLVIWHFALADTGIACDVCIWSDFTHARLPNSAAIEGFTLRAAEKYKNDKYVELCAQANMQFAAMALNPLGGLGPRLAELIDLAWEQRLAEAKAGGHDTRRLQSQKRRAFEKLSAEMARCAHRAIYTNTTARAASESMPTSNAEPPEEPIRMPSP
jgi:hypothetical protein